MHKIFIKRHGEWLFSAQAETFEELHEAKCRLERQGHRIKFETIEVAAAA